VRDRSYGPGHDHESEGDPPRDQAILLDTFVVRTLVIPALFALIGPIIWWPSGTDNRAPQSPLKPAAAMAARHRR